MSEATTPGEEPQDHREQTDWVAMSKVSGTDRRLHRVEGDPGPDDLETGEEVEVACDASLHSGASRWRAKPASVFPVGYRPLCQNEGCFGEGPNDS